MINYFARFKYKDFQIIAYLLVALIDNSLWICHSTLFPGLSAYSGSKCRHTSLVQSCFQTLVALDHHPPLYQECPGQKRAALNIQVLKLFLIPPCPLLICIPTNIIYFLSDFEMYMCIQDHTDRRNKIKSACN